MGFGYDAIGLVTSGAQIAFLAAAFLSPALTTKFGDGSVIVGAVFAAGLLLVSLSLVETVFQIGLIMALLGACAALMVIPTVGVIALVVPYAYRSRVNGLVSSGTAYGQVIAGLLTPWVLLAHGWRSVWVVVGLISVAIAFLGFIALKRSAPDAFDGPKVQQLAEDEEVNGNGTLFTRSNLTVWALLALSGMACGPWQNYLATFLREEKSLSIALVGQLWSSIGIIGLFSGFAMGMLADRIGIKRVLGGSYILLIASALLVAFHTSNFEIQSATALFGLSFFAVYGLIPAYISKTVSAGQATKVFAGANICLGLGTAFGNVTGGYIPHYTGSLQTVFIFVGIIAALGFFGSMSLQGERSDENDDLQQKARTL
jgi:MFS family permease